MRRPAVAGQQELSWKPDVIISDSFIFLALQTQSKSCPTKKQPKHMITFCLEVLQGLLMFSKIRNVFTFLNQHVHMISFSFTRHITSILGELTKYTETMLICQMRHQVSSFEIIKNPCISSNTKLIINEVTKTIVSKIMFFLSISMI